MRKETAFTVSDIRSAFHYLDVQQIEYDILDTQASTRYRKEIARRINKLYPWAPIGQLRHGRFWGYLGDCIPERVWLEGCSTELFCTTAKQRVDLTIVFERSQVPAFRVDTRSIPNSMLISDLIAFSDSSMETLFVMNHEQADVAIVNDANAATAYEIRSYRNNKVVESYCPSNANDAELLFSDSGVAYLPLSIQKTRNIRDYIRRKLSLKLKYFPSRALSQRVHLDWIWNYLPVELSVGDNKKQASEYFCANVDELLLIFEDRTIPAYIVNASSVIRLASKLNDAYIVDWPGKRWMLAFASDDMYPTRFVWFDW